MIAFIRLPEEPVRSPAMHRAHRMLATALLRPAARDDAPPLPGWKAWLFAGWLVAAAVWCATQVVRSLL